MPFGLKLKHMKAWSVFSITFWGYLNLLRLSDSKLDSKWPKNAPAREGWKPAEGRPRTKGEGECFAPFNFYFKNARFLFEFVDFWSRFSRKMFPKKTSKILKFITFSKILHFGGTHFHFRPSLAWCRLGWNSSIWKLKVCFQLLSEDILIYCVYLIQNWIQSDQKTHQRGKAESQPKASLGPRRVLRTIWFFFWKYSFVA